MKAARKPRRSIVGIVEEAGDQVNTRSASGKTAAVVGDGAVGQLERLASHNSGAGPKSLAGPIPPCRQVE
jgi:hypothetical protein